MIYFRPEPVPEPIVEPKLKILPEVVEKKPEAEIKPISINIESSKESCHVLTEDNINSKAEVLEPHLSTCANTISKLASRHLSINVNDSQDNL